MNDRVDTCDCSTQRREVGDVALHELDAPRREPRCALTIAHEPVPARVDEACRRVDEQTEPTERALALEPRNEIVRQPDAFERRPEHEFPGMKHEGMLPVHLDELGELLLLDLYVDERVPVVV